MQMKNYSKMAILLRKCCNSQSKKLSSATSFNEWLTKLTGE